MNPQTATTREQSDRLTAIGVDPKTADMYRMYWDKYGEQVSKEDFEQVCINPADGRVELVPKDYGDYDQAFSGDDPAWSLSALFEVIPPLFDGACLAIQRTASTPTPMWGIAYMTFEGKIGHRHFLGYRNPIITDDLIEGLVRMAEWLAEEGYSFESKEG